MTVKDAAVSARQVGIRQIPDHMSGPVVVVDVLRAFTTAPWILAGGAASLTLAASPADALRMKNVLGPAAVAITDSELTPGFDLGNSPAQVQRFPVAHRPVVQATSNGTVGVHAARLAPLVLCAGLVTATATAEALRAHGGEEITYVITGHDGTAEEDAACADLIDALVTGNPRPSNTINRVQNSRAAAGVRQRIAAAHPGVHPDDIWLACEIDRFDFAVVATDHDGSIQVSRRPMPHIRE